MSVEKRFLALCESYGVKGEVSMIEIAFNLFVCLENYTKFIKARDEKLQKILKGNENVKFTDFQK